MCSDRPVSIRLSGFIYVGSYVVIYVVYYVDQKRLNFKSLCPLGFTFVPFVFMDFIFGFPSTQL